VYMSRIQKAAQRQVVGILTDWPEPHGSGPLTDSSTLRGIEVHADGAVNIIVKPSRAHCPCCLLDLVDLRQVLLKKKQVASVHIEVVEIPESHRWTNSINE